MHLNALLLRPSISAHLFSLENDVFPEQTALHCMQQIIALCLCVGDSNALDPSSPFLIQQSIMLCITPNTLTHTRPHTRYAHAAYGMEGEKFEFNWHFNCIQFNVAAPADSGKGKELEIPPGIDFPESVPAGRTIHTNYITLRFRVFSSSSRVWCIPHKRHIAHSSLQSRGQPVRFDIILISHFAHDCAHTLSGFFKIGIILLVPRYFVRFETVSYGVPPLLQGKWML